MKALQRQRKNRKRLIQKQGSKRVAVNVGMYTGLISCNCRIHRGHCLYRMVYKMYNDKMSQRCGRCTGMHLAKSINEQQSRLPSLADSTDT
jgi:hypothetical protein